MMGKFLLLLGVSGVGKSSVIEELTKLDSRFRYISPYMTRSNRLGEKNKIPVSDEEMDKMKCEGKLLVINELYGVRYATPSAPIQDAFITGDFPVLDWPIARLMTMSEAFPRQLYIVYIAPPSIEILKERLNKDNRDTDGKRLQLAQEELEAFWAGKYKDMYDLQIILMNNQLAETARVIYDNYLQAIC